MNHWLTVHWPPNVGQPSFQEPEGVYVPEGLEHLVAEMAIGDKVVVYESATAEPIVAVQVDGSKLVQHRQRGRQGVLTLSEVTSPLLCYPDTETEHYIGRAPIKWSWRAVLRTLNRSGSLPLNELSVHGSGAYWAVLCRFEGNVGERVLVPGTDRTL